VSNSDLSIAVSVQRAPAIILKGEVLAQIDDLAATAAITEVKDQTSADDAARALRQATSLSKALEEARKEATAPALELQRAIAAAVKEPASRLDAAKRDLQNKLGNFQAEQARIAREQREAEERRRREEEKRRLAELLDTTPKPAEQPSVAVTTAPVALPVAPVKVAGTRLRVSLEFVVSDASKLPVELTRRVPDLDKIKAQCVALWRDGDPIPEVSGVSFSVSRRAVSA
jgi:hypothetical protein